MDIPVAVRDLVAKAVRLEGIRDTESAEATYLEALTRLGDSAPIFRGVLYINLGTNAQHAERLADAVEYFRKSIEILERERGEAHLQCAHAHFNLAYQLYRCDDPGASAHAAEASKRYQANPHADPVDRADASMLYVLCRLFIESRGDEKTLADTWADVRNCRSDALNPELLENFMINFLAFNRHLHPDRYSSLQAEVRAWLSAMPQAGKLAELLDDGSSGRLK